jgi:hypothetical protein
MGVVELKTPQGRNREVLEAGRKSLEQQAVKYIAEAEADRRSHETWLRDVYRFALPWRRRPSSWKQVHDQDELFDPTAIEATADFTADMQATFTPPDDDWLGVEPAETMQEFEKEKLKAPIANYKRTVFAEIRRSNFHEASQEAYPDLAAGTASMCIQDIDITQPIQCQAIPITDLLIARGVYGGVDFRCREIRNMRVRDLAPTYPNATIPASVKRLAEKDAGATICVRECVWRLWDKKPMERWQYCLLIDNKLAEDDIFEGTGSCPIIVARWRTDSTTALGTGALYVVIPTIKTLDQLCYLILKHLNFRVDPATSYEDDGVINLENGLTPGTAIARAQGSKAPEILESEGDLNTAFFERSEMQTQIKRALFQDKPEQPGKTPPTLGQWLDERARTAQRMGAPIGRLTTEWQWAIFARFAYLMAKRGVLPSVDLNGKVIRLRPESPLIKAQRQQGVNLADRCLEIFGVRLGGPQVVPLFVDTLKTAVKIKEMLGADAVILRSEEDIKQIVKTSVQAGQALGQIPSPDQQQGGGGAGP